MKGSLWVRLCLGVPARASLAALASVLLAGSSFGQSAYAKGRIVVQFQPGFAIQTANAQDLMGARPVARLGHGRAMILAVPSGVDERKFAEAFASRPGVEFAEPDYIFELQAPNDPHYPNQWHLHKTVVPAAWNYTKGSSDVIIAILDSGVDPTHPDLAPKLVPGWNFISGNDSMLDDNGHGTAVAGSATAATDNALGIAGLAWNARLMPIKVAGSNGSAYSSTLYNGLVWAADHGARVANMSFMVSSSSLVKSGMSYFRSKGGVSTVSAGNYNTEDTNPDNPDCLTVAATDSNDAKASWSNYGTIVDMTAPGVGILTTNRGGGYGSWSGTSFSAPITAGAVALVFAANPALDPAQAIAIIKDNTDDIGTPGWDKYFGTGRLNVEKAVYAALSTAEDGEEPTVSINGPGSGDLSGTVSVSVDASDNIYVKQVSLYVDGTLVATKTQAPYTFNWDTTTVQDGSHMLTASAEDLAGNQGYAEFPVTVKNNIGDTTPPSVSFTNPTNGQSVFGPLTISADASDDAGLETVKLYIDGTLIRTFKEAPYSLVWSSLAVKDGNHSLKLVARDTSGNEKTAEVAITVVNFVDTEFPTVSFVNPVEGQVLNGGSTQISITAADNRTVKWVKFYIDNTLIRTMTAAPYAINFSPKSVVDGAHVFKAVACDGVGNETTATVNVTVSNSSSSYNDTEAPTVRFTNPTDGQTVSGYVEIQLEAFDNVGVESVQLFIDGVLYRTFTHAPFKLNWSTKSVADGVRSLQAVAKDAKGNTSTAIVILNVKNY